MKKKMGGENYLSALFSLCFLLLSSLSFLVSGFFLADLMPISVTTIVNV